MAEKEVTLDFTIAIPTYNGASRLPKLLARLQQQKNVVEISWEIIIIDNDSQDNTAKIIKSYQNNWQQNYPLRYFLETKQGAAFARLRGGKEAKGKLIGFIDDDVLPDYNWLAEAWKFGCDRPHIGAYSGSIHGEFESPPPENFDKIAGFLAIRKYGNQAQLFDPPNLRLPPTASLVVNRQAWQESAPINPVLIGRVGGKMLGGEDYEMLIHIHSAGWEIWYNPAMNSYHQIPSWRLERDYLLALAYHSGLPTCYLRSLSALPWQKPLIAIKIILGSLRRMFLISLKYQGRVKTDLVAACEWQFFWGNILSVFYYILNWSRKST